MQSITLHYNFFLHSIFALPIFTCRQKQQTQHSWFQQSPQLVSQHQKVSRRVKLELAVTKVRLLWEDLHRVIWVWAFAPVLCIYVAAVCPTAEQLHWNAWAPCECQGETRDMKWEGRWLQLGPLSPIYMVIGWCLLQSGRVKVLTVRMPSPSLEPPQPHLATIC